MAALTATRTGTVQQARVEAHEWRFVIGVIVFVLAVTTIPYLFAYLTTPPDKQYMGLMVNVPDHVQYFSWMRELTQANLISNKLTPEPNKPIFFNLLWWMMGRLGLVLGLDYAMMFQLLRVVSTLAFLLLVYRMCAWFLDDRLMRRMAFLLVVFASGFGWALVVIKYALRLPDVPLPILLYTFEPNTFLSILSTPHLIDAALYMFVFDLVLRGEVKGQLRYAVGAGLFAQFMGWQHAYDLFLVYGILGGYGLLRILRDRQLPMYLVKAGLIVGLLSVWPGLYSLLLTSLDPIWKDVLAQFDNAGIFTPNLLLLPVLMGGTFLLALFTFVKDRRWALKSQDDKTLFITAWFAFNFVLIYLPTDYQIKMLNGWQVPIAILATQGLFKFVLPALDRLSARRGWGWKSDTLRTGLAAALLIVVIPTNLYLLGWRFVELRRHEYSYFMYKDEVAAMQWLSSNANGNDVVLASLTTGQYIPALTGAHTFLAHWAQTVDYYGKTAMVDEFFAEGTEDTRRQEILKRYNVNYVLYGPAEQALGPYRPDQSDFLVEVFSSPKVKVYEVSNAN